MTLAEISDRSGDLSPRKLWTGEFDWTFLLKVITLFFPILSATDAIGFCQVQWILEDAVRVHRIWSWVLSLETVHVI